MNSVCNIIQYTFNWCTEIIRCKFWAIAKMPKTAEMLSPL